MKIVLPYYVFGFLLANSAEAFAPFGIAHNRLVGRPLHVGSSDYLGSLAYEDSIRSSLHGSTASYLNSLSQIQIAAGGVAPTDASNFDSLDLIDSAISTPTSLPHFLSEIPSTLTNSADVIGSAVANGASTGNANIVGSIATNTAPKPDLTDVKISLEKATNELADTLNSLQASDAAKAKIAASAPQVAAQPSAQAAAAKATQAHSFVDSASKGGFDSRDFVEQQSTAAKHLLDHMSHKVAELADAAKDLKAPVIDSQKLVDSAANVGTNLGTSVARTTASEATKIASTTQTSVKTAIQATGDTSVTEAARNFLIFMKQVAIVVLDVFEAFIEAVTGKTLPEIGAGVAASVKGVISQAIGSVEHSLQGIAHMSVAEFSKDVYIVVVAIAKVFYAVANALVRSLSGKDISGWATTATVAVADKAGEFRDAAAHQVNEFGQQSLAAVATGIAHFLDQTTTIMVEAVKSLDQAGGADMGSAYASGTMQSVTETLSLMSDKF